MTADPPARVQAWDSEFFGRRIARVVSARLDARNAERVRAWARAEAIACLYFAADAADLESVHAAEDAGFRLMDLRVTRECALDGRPREAAAGVDPARPEDVPALCGIARTSHHNTRFFKDPNFPRERCEALYETWVRNACSGNANLVLVARHSGRPAGYLVCVLDDHARGRVSLVAVAEEARRRGLGERLLSGALAWFAERGCQSVEAATQGHHVAAARFYEKLGFRTRAVECWMHCWLEGPGTAP